jgi:sugar lactone lactonase YvrE
MKAEVVSNVISELGEGPLYHEGRFYWVDILAGKLKSIIPGDDKCQLLYEGAKAPTSVVAGKDGSLYMTLTDGFYKFTDEGASRVGAFKITDPHMRFNDGKCDLFGNYWAGTMDTQEVSPKGSLYVLRPSGEVLEILTGITVSNGLCWNDDMSTFYYVDSPTKEVRAYDFDSLAMTLTKPRTIYTVKKDGAFPDGMCIDMDGNLWLALWNGYSVICLDPYSGQVLDEIEVPCRKVTSCSFGGEVYDELFITTSTKGMDGSDWQKYPDSGKIFKARPGIIGLPLDTFG